LQKKNYAHQAQDELGEAIYQRNIELKHKRSKMGSSAQITSTIGVIGDSNAPDKDAEEFYKKPVSENVGWGRILSYYRPWYYTFAISMISIVSVWGFLLVGGFVVTTIILFMTYEMGTRGLAGSF